jgi:hypothetical protein
MNLTRGDQLRARKRFVENLKVENGDGVTTRGEPLEEMMLLVRSALEPIGFLDDSDFHRDL